MEKDTAAVGKVSLKKTKRSLKSRFSPLKTAFGTKLTRQKAQTIDHVTSGISSLIPIGSQTRIENGQSTTCKPVSISVIQDLRPITLPSETEMPQGPAEKKKKRPKPVGTVEYQVHGTDTLASIAIQFDSTPSELVKLNKLSSRIVFPGQFIYVPDPNHDSGSELSVSPPQLSPPSTSPPADKPRMDIPIIKMADGPPTRIPGHVERQISSSSSQPDIEEFPARKLSEDEARELDQECYERFIKVNVKHITDGQGVVNGVLLVTPNAIMFDPNVSDPLVIEHGPEMYGMMAPMDTIITASMYHDIATMRLSGLAEDRSSSPRPEVYHGKNCPMFEMDHFSYRKCYRGEDVSLCNDTEPNLLVTVGSLISETGSSCSCGVSGKDPENLDQSNSSITVKDDMIGRSNSQLELSQVDHSNSNISEADLIAQEVRVLVNNAVQRAVESEMALHKSEENSKDLVTPTNNANTDATKDLEGQKPIVFVQDTVPISAKETVLHELQNNLKDLDLESECTLDSSGTGTLVDTTGDTSLYTSCATDLSSIITNDSLLEIRDANMSDTALSLMASNPNSTPKDPHSQKMSSPTELTGLESLTQQELSPGLKEHMQIGNITYYQYSELSDSDLTGSDGKEATNQRLPSKSDPISMPGGNKEEVAEGRSASFGSFSSPHISAFVNYATGLFRNTADDHKLVKDITEGRSIENSVEEISVSDTTGTKSLELSDKHVAVQNAIKIDDMPELFQSIDELIPRPATRIEEPPLYLCLRVGKPIRQRVHSTGPIESYSRKKKKPEYWFSIPRDKVDQLYAFFVQWTPEKYGDEEDIDLASRGFVVVDDEDPELAENEALDIFEEYFGPSTSQRIHRDWEIVNKEEYRRRSIDVYEPLPLPELIGSSAILSENYIIQISKVLPGRAVGYPWTLVYSTESNGFSLKTLYRNMNGLEGPILLVVQDTTCNVFGALVACPLTISEHFYGTGESFLYTFTPHFCVYKWSGENNFFIKGNKDSLAIGAGQGVFGLWFDEDLYHGRSNHCETYDNDPLTASEDFVLKGLEAWAFSV